MVKLYSSCLLMTYSLVISTVIVKFHANDVPSSNISTTISEVFYIINTVLVLWFGTRLGAMTSFTYKFRSTTEMA